MPGIGRLSHAADDIHDDAPAPFAHQGQIGARQADVSENLGFPTFAPAGVIDHVKVAPGNGTGAVDQNVGIETGSN